MKAILPINPLKPSDGQWTRLVDMMACRMFSTKPLSQQMQTYCQLVTP